MWKGAQRAWLSLLLLLRRDDEAAKWLDILSARERRSATKRRKRERHNMTRIRQEHRHIRPVAKFTSRGVRTRKPADHRKELDEGMVYETRVRCGHGDSVARPKKHRDTLQCLNSSSILKPNGIIRHDLDSHGQLQLLLSLLPPESTTLTPRPYPTVRQRIVVG